MRIELEKERWFLTKAHGNKWWGVAPHYVYVFGFVIEKSTKEVIQVLVYDNLVLDRKTEDYVMTKHSRWFEFNPIDVEWSLGMLSYVDANKLWVRFIRKAQQVQAEEEEARKNLEKLIREKAEALIREREYQKQREIERPGRVQNLMTKLFLVDKAEQMKQQLRFKKGAA